MLSLPVDFDFSASWSRAWSGLSAAGDGIELRDALLARYGEAQRKYHTRQHLAESLSLFEAVSQAPDHPAEVEMALWFHDAIYDLRASDNEARSAVWACEALTAAGVAEPRAARVRDLVLVTQHQQLPRTPDERVLVDIDLSILGAPAARFAEYEQQIREEYAYVPGFLFRMKRRAILKSFLDRDSIYGTPVLHQRLEAMARGNLARAIAGETTG